MLVVSARVSDRRRAVLRAASVAGLLESARPVLKEDRLVRTLGEELVAKRSVLEAFRAAQTEARKIGRDPLGWASLTLFVN